MPAFVGGGHYNIYYWAAGERLEFPVAYEDETMLATLGIRE